MRFFPSLDAHHHSPVTHRLGGCSGDCLTSEGPILPHKVNTTHTRCASGACFLYSPAGSPRPEQVPLACLHTHKPSTVRLWSWCGASELAKSKPSPSPTLHFTVEAQRGKIACLEAHSQEEKCQDRDLGLCISARGSSACHTDPGNTSLL